MAQTLDQELSYALARESYWRALAKADEESHEGKSASAVTAAYETLSNALLAHNRSGYNRPPVLQPFSLGDDQPVENLNLSIRTTNHIREFGIKTIGELCDKTLDQFLERRGFGMGSRNELENSLARVGRSLRKEQ